MKRTIAEITGGVPATYEHDMKRRKLDTQKIGDFIVNAIDAFHFKIVDS